MENPNYEQIVHEAAIWLDGVEPGWHKKINREEFDMSSCIRCVFGQLFGVYDEGLRWLVRYGKLFKLLRAFDVESEAHVGRYPLLQKLWLAEINSRLEADRQSEADKFLERTTAIINQPVEVAR